jgi:hypothetical protein
MKKYIATIAVMALAATTASAVVIEAWEMNDPNGTTLSNLVNSAGSAAFNSQAPNVTTLNGNLRYTQGSGNLFNIAPLTVQDVTSGQYELSFMYTAADFSSGDAAGANVGFGIRDTTTNVDKFLIRLQKVSGTIRLQSRISGANTTLHNFGASVLPDSVSVRAVFDVGTGALDVFYAIGAGPESSTSLTMAAGEMDSIRIANNLNPIDFGATDFAEVDYLRLDQIPEPATLGMIAFGSGAIMFIRRRMLV